MTIQIRKGTVRTALRSGQWVLGSAALLLLAWCGLIWVDGWRFQKAERRHLEVLLHARQENVPEVSLPARPANLGLIGWIEIPGLGVSVIVEEGIDRRTLRHAAGHIPGTALPGQAGNIGISGHRDTFFRPLRKIRQADLITLTTTLGVYHYRVVSVQIVDPSNVAVLDPSAKEVLTLVTCYPFYFVGPAPSRFIVRAERII